MLKYRKVLYYFLVAVSFLALNINSVEASTDAKVFILVGQSNAEGSGARFLFAPGEFSPLENVWIDQTTPNIPASFSSSFESIGNESLFIGPEANFAKILRDAYPDSQIVIIKVSQPATGLEYWNNPVELGHQTLMDRIDVVSGWLDNVVKAGDISSWDFSGILSVQGENESDSIESVAQNYDVNFGTLITQIRTKANILDLPVILARVSDNFDPINGGSARQPSLSIVQQKQNDFFDNDINAGIVGTNDLNLSDGWHYDTTSQLILGQRFAYEYLKLTENRPILKITLSESQENKTFDPNVQYNFNFDIPVNSFDQSKITILGDTGADEVDIEEISPFNGMNFRITVSGMENTGMIDLKVDEGFANSSTGLSLNAINENTAIFYSPHLKVGDLLAYDSFESISKPLHKASNGIGWSGGWLVQNNLLNGYLTSGISPLTYPNLLTSKSYATGGENYQTSGRLLDLERTFLPYMTDKNSESINLPGTTIWGSYLVKVNNAGQKQRFSLLRGTASTYSDADNMFRIQQREGNWKIALMNTNESSMIDTGISVVDGQTYFIVYRLHIGGSSNDSSAHVWINPESNSLGGPDLDLLTANASSTIINNDFNFRRINWYPGNSAGNGEISDVRLGLNFASVAPNIFYDVNYFSLGNGEIEGDSNQTLTFDQSSSLVTAVADNGYRFTGWDDGSLDNPRTDDNIRESISFRAIFEDEPLAPESESTQSGISSVGGSSVRGRVINLEKMGKTEEAEALKQKFPNAFDDEEQENDNKIISTKSSIDLSVIIEVLISLNLIPEDKIAVARRLVNQSTSTSEFIFTRDLEINMEGNDVRELQQYLIGAGYSIPAGPSNFFGPQTEAALIQFQIDNNISPAIGYFGAVTRSKINLSN